MSMATVGLEGSRPSVMVEGSQKSILRILGRCSVSLCWERSVLVLEVVEAGEVNGERSRPSPSYRGRWRQRLGYSTCINRVPRKRVTPATAVRKCDNHEAVSKYTRQLSINN